MTPNEKKEEDRKREQEMLRNMEEEGAKYARGDGVDKASAQEKPMLTQEEIEALLSSDQLTQEEIDALLWATEPTDSDHAAEKIDDDILAAMEKALEELNQQRAEGEKRQAEREEASNPDVE